MEAHFFAQELSSTHRFSVRLHRICAAELGNSGTFSNPINILPKLWKQSFLFIYRHPWCMGLSYIWTANTADHKVVQYFGPNNFITVISHCNGITMYAWNINYIIKSSLNFVWAAKKTELLNWGLPCSLWVRSHKSHFMTQGNNNSTQCLSPFHIHKFFSPFLVQEPGSSFECGKWTHLTSSRDPAVVLIWLAQGCTGQLSQPYFYTVTMWI